MQSKTLSLTALAAILASGVALAQTTPPASTSPDSSTGSMGLGAEYTKMDKDKNGTLSKKEAASNKDLTKQWGTLDVNKDGQLDEAEFSQFEAESLSGDGMTDSMSKDTKPKY